MNIFSVSVLVSNFILPKALADAAEPWQIGFQDPATPVMQGLINLH